MPQCHIGSLDTGCQGRETVRMTRVLLINSQQFGSLFSRHRRGGGAVPLPWRAGHGRRDAAGRAAGDLFLARLACGDGADVPAGRALGGIARIEAVPVTILLVATGGATAAAFIFLALSVWPADYFRLMSEPLLLAYASKLQAKDTAVTEA